MMTPKEGETPMKQTRHHGLLALLAAALLLPAGCAESPDNPSPGSDVVLTEGETLISLSDDGVTVQGEPVSQDSSSAVYEGADIVFYQSGQGEGYGEGAEQEAHTEQEAQSHTVLTITSPGTYRVTGTLSQGQIVVDLGEESRTDALAVVNLVLDDADLTCTVAPAILVKNAYECGSADTASATAEVDTTGAGFNLVLADDSDNTVSGAYVAKIYQPGTTDTLYKYDAAIDSLVSFNINGEQLGNGILTVNAQNEGIESFLHLTVNAGDITVFSQDDGLNANADFVSVLTINGGHLHCTVDGGGEGDGIDSNGYLVINDGHILVSADQNSADSGLDSDLGIYLNGGTVLATGNMFDEISADSAQPYVAVQFSERREGGSITLMEDEQGQAVAAFAPSNGYSVLVYSDPSLSSDTSYSFSSVSSVTGSRHASLYTDITAFENAVPLGFSEAGGREGAAPGRHRPDGAEPPEGAARPEGDAPPEGEPSPDGAAPPAFPEGGRAPGERPSPDGQPAEQGAQGSDSSGQQETA